MDHKLNTTLSPKQRVVLAATTKLTDSIALGCMESGGGSAGRVFSSLRVPLLIGDYVGRTLPAVSNPMRFCLLLYDAMIRSQWYVFSVVRMSWYRRMN